MQKCVKFHLSSQPYPSPQRLIRPQVDMTVNFKLDLTEVPSGREFVTNMVTTSVFVLIIAVMIAVSVTWYTTKGYDDQIHGQAMRTAVFLPLLIVPVCTSVVGYQGWRNHVRLTQIAHLARTDEMTGLSNRRAFMQAASHVFATTDFEYSGVSLLIVDLDHFKQVNDVHGHDAGDEVLIHAAHQMVRAAPRNSLVARLGGEEFGILMPYETITELHQNAEAIRARVASHPCIYKDLPIKISASVGVGVAHRRDTVSSVLSRADDALYEAKDQGRNRYIVDAA